MCKKLITSLCFLKLVLKIIQVNDISSKARIDPLIFKQRLMDSIIILQAPMAQFLITLPLFQGMTCTTYCAFFANIGPGMFWPSDIIPPRLHLPGDHAADFMERWSTGHLIYCEQGAESIHKVFNILRRT